VPIVGGQEPPTPGIRTPCRRRAQPRNTLVLRLNRALLRWLIFGLVSEP